MSDVFRPVGFADGATQAASVMKLLALLKA